MKNIVKYMSIAALALGLTIQAKAASTTVVIQQGGFSNVLSNFRGAATVSAVTISSTTTNAARVAFIDSPTNSLTYVVPAYSNITFYATNYITSYTNFFGVVNSFTNVALLRATNSVAAATNSYAIPFQGTAATNSSSLFTGVNYYFNNGIWVTNQSAVGAAAVTVTYQQ